MRTPRTAGAALVTLVLALSGFVAPAFAADDPSAGDGVPDSSSSASVGAPSPSDSGLTIGEDGVGPDEAGTEQEPTPAVPAEPDPEPAPEPEPTPPVTPESAVPSEPTPESTSVPEPEPSPEPEASVTPAPVTPPEPTATPPAADAPEEPARALMAAPVSRPTAPDHSAFRPGASRVQGSSRFETVIAASRIVAPNGADVLFITADERFPDQLSVAPAQKRTRAAHLIVGTRSIPATVEAEIRRLAPRTIYVVGGENAVAPTVMTRLRQLTGVSPVRLSGTSRLETNAMLTNRFFTGQVPAVVVAHAASTPDQLVGGNAAAAVDGPIILSYPSGPDAGARQMLARLRPSTIYIAGWSWSAAARQAMSQAAGGARIVDLSGVDRSRTSALVTEGIWGATGTGLYASQDNYADAVATATLGAVHRYPVILAPKGCLLNTVATIVSTQTRRVIIGGPSTLSIDVPQSRCAWRATSNLGKYREGRYRVTDSTAASLAAQTAAKFAREGSGTVFITNRDAWIDQAGISPIAKYVGATQLLVDSGSVPEATRRELQRQDPVKIYVVGGTSQVSSSVVSELGRITRAKVERIAGSSRYQTNELLNRRFMPTGRWMVMAAGDAIQDQVTASSAAAHRGGMLVLVDRARIAPSTTALLRDLRPSNITTVGGRFPDSLYSAITGATGISGVFHARGDLANDTAIEVMKHFWGGPAATIVHEPVRETVDTLTVTMLAAYYDAPVLLTEPRCTGWPRQTAVARQTRGFYIGSQNVIDTNAAHNVCWFAEPTFQGNVYRWNMRHQTQQTDYFCGNTSGAIILDRLGWHTSKDGVPLSQWNLGGPRYMDTVAVGYTSWEWDKFNHGMREWTGGALPYTKTHAPSDAFTRDRVWDSFTRTGRPVVVEPKEYAWGAHLNNHPRGTFAHLMVVEGWDLNNWDMLVMDPGAGWLFPNSAQVFRWNVWGSAPMLAEFGIFY